MKINENITPKHMFIAVFSCFFIAIIAWLQVKPTGNILLSNELLELNNKYGVIDAEPLDSKEDVNLHRVRRLRASLIDTTVDKKAPEQGLIIKMKNKSEEDKNDLSNVIVLKMKTNSSIDKISTEYQKLDDVVYAEPNHRIFLTDINDETEEEESTPISIINEETLDLDKKTTVAIIDSGADIKHKDLQGRISKTWNTLSQTENVDDLNGHGTHIAGILLKNSQSAQASIIQFTTDGRDGTILSLVRAIKYATDNNSQVMNLSLGIPTYSNLMREAITYARDKGVIIIAATGNRSSEEILYPASWSDVISVSALNLDGEKFMFSNYGDDVEFSAIGQDVFSAAPENKYVYKSGTSQAASVVTAVTADIISLFESNSKEPPSLEKVRQLLQKISEPISTPKMGRKISNGIDQQDRILLLEELNNTTVQLDQTIKEVVKLPL